MQNGNTTNTADTAIIRRMSLKEKGAYIMEHLRSYRKHCRRNNGRNIGFMFPDGSRITKEDASELLYF